MRSWLSTSRSTPPEFEAELERRHLRGLLAPLAAVEGETELAVADDGLVGSTVGTAVVTAVEAVLHETLCERYTATSGTVGVDADALCDVLATEREDAPVRLACDPDEETLTLESPSFVHTQSVEADVAVEPPAVGEPERGAATYHDGADLAGALDYVADRSGVVALGYDEVADAFYLETPAPATAATHTRYRRPRGDLPGPVTPGPSRSSFPVDPLAAIVEAVPPETVVRADHAESFPVRLAWDLAGGDGIREGTLTEVSALVAPHDGVGAADQS